MIGVARRLLRLSMVIVGLVVVYLAVTALQVRGAANTDNWARSSHRTEAIVVLGAAQYDGKPSPVLAKRLDHALELHQQGAAETIVVTGFKRADDRFTEAYAGFKYLRNHGVPESALVVVDDGSNTWESLSAVKRVLAKRGIDEVVLVSTRYHNRRLQGISGELGLRAEVSSVGPAASGPQIVSETLKVAVGQVIGYRRLAVLTS